ncbi:MAG: hypothetical protein ACUVQ8_01750 [Nitrososphaeria archaeon]
MWQLIHHGVYIPKYEPVGLTLKYKGLLLRLDAEAEQMAIAFVKKFGTDNMSDPVFVSNFLRDFNKKMGISEASKVEDFDWREIVDYIEQEKRKRESLSREEKKRIAEERKKAKEVLKEKYGYATVNGSRVVLQNWIVEPPCIFTSKGKNPMRGRWKRAITREEITLNLSERPDGLENGWKEIVWKDDCMWIASWRNPLNGKMKYVWFSPNSRIRQDREIEKWDKALELKSKIKDVEEKIWEGLRSKDENRRKLATAVYLIKESGIRVGDERVAGEMGTVGCTTLKDQNIQLDGSKVILDFVGKDYVQWHREIALPSKVITNLRELKEKANGGAVFDGINSQKVARFLQEVVPGASAKTFRTMIAGETLKKAVKETRGQFNGGEFENIIRFKYINCAVAKRLNHKRKLPDRFEEKLLKKEERMNARRIECESLQANANDGKEKAKIMTKIERANQLYRKALLEYLVYKDTSEWNLNTSLTSYIDPRLVTEYARKNRVPIERLYSRSLREKFSWAIPNTHLESHPQ